ncbi:MAG: metallophosphoesterase [Candidatus Magnetobacterium sp. LHC-1]
MQGGALKQIMWLVAAMSLLLVVCSATSLDCSDRKSADNADKTGFEEYLASGADGMTDTFRFVVYGDTRGNLMHTVNTDVISRINAHIVSLNPAPLFVIHTGDLARRGGSDAYGSGKKAMKQLNDASIPYAMAVGNHELYASFPAWGRTNISAHMQSEYQATFCTSNTVGPICFPQEPKLPGYENLVFAFELGNSFFAILATYYVTKDVKYYDDISPEQLQWFRERVSGSSKKHRFVFAHKSVYSSGVHDEHPPATTHMLELMGVLNDNHVDIYFAGHEHYYVRRKIETADGHRWSNGVTQIVTGGGGAPLHKPNPAYGLSACASRYSFTVIDVTANEILGTTYGFNSLTDDIVPIDKFCLLGAGKPCPGWEAQDRIVAKCA